MSEDTRSAGNILIRTTGICYTENFRDYFCAKVTAISLRGIDKIVFFDVAHLPRLYFDATYDT